MDIDRKTYEGFVDRAHFVPQDGERPKPAPSEDPEELPGKKQPPAHKDGPRVPSTGVWDEESQAFRDLLDTDRKQNNDSDYPQPDGGPAGRFTAYDVRRARQPGARMSDCGL